MGSIREWTNRWRSAQADPPATDEPGQPPRSWLERIIIMLGASPR